MDDISTRGGALLRLASQEVSSDIENKLRPFGGFMEPNPRFMKRVVNFYGIARSIEITSAAKNEERKDFGKWIRWIILCLRWPRLTEYLHTNPGLINHLHNEQNNHQSQEDRIYDLDFKQLISNDNQIYDIIRHDSDHKYNPLNEFDVRYFSSLMI